MTSSLGTEYPVQQARVRALITRYRALPDGAGNIGAMLMEDTLKRADAAAISGDLLGMITSFKEMETCE
ncbi:MAG: hypothetical protein V3T22_10410 [Planctomycetota bacterium]